MNTEIYYFSGTGNSLFAVKELQKRLPGAAVHPIIRLLGEEKPACAGGAVGFVFPVHALSVPIAVRKFIRKLDMRAAKYVFAVATRNGTVFHGFKTLERMLGRKGKRLDAQFIVNMCNNDTRHGVYQTPSAREIAAIEKETLKKIDSAAKIILERGRHGEDIRDHKIPSASNPAAAFLVERLVTALFGLSEHTKGVNYFYHDEKCAGCGICEKVCLSGKISLADGRPVWSRDTFCHMCFACLNFCPKQAVQIKSIPGVKSLSKENGRYPHPYANVCDMLAQKGGEGRKVKREFIPEA